MYDKNKAAPFPPMGWNSYDYYNTTVNEAQVRANTEYMAQKLKPYGWEYVVIDIQWSDPDAGRKNNQGYQYIPFSQFCIDEWSRQIPAENRFPSSSGGNGFKPLSDYIHSLGLKFGIHIMRGIPRFAAHNHLPIKTHDGTAVTADLIANPYSVSKWNPDMYGVDASKPYAQDYYDSIFALYAQWGVDYVKVDDICNTNMYPHAPYSAEKEIEMMAAAIENSGRQMVLSLSPGPAVIEKAWHYEKYANMWRITDDFWDDWKLLKAMFERCEVWQKHVGNGNWPDCDMLPMNVLGWGWGNLEDKNNKGWKCKFTPEETRTMMSLWCIFRAPLMIGTDLPQLDEYNLSLLTNSEILNLEKNSRDAFQLMRNEKQCIWISYGKGCPASGRPLYAALFNLSDEKSDVSVPLKTIPGMINEKMYAVRDLWKGEDLFPMAGDAVFSMELPPHGSAVISFR